MADAVRIDELNAGDHACLTFTDADERVDLLAEFVADGLRLGQRVVCFTDTASPDDFAAELALREIPAAAAIRDGQLSMGGNGESWLAGGPVTASRMITVIAGELERAVATGFPGVRVTADMGWATRAVVAVDELVTFESQVGSLFGDGQLTVLCQYDRDSFDPVTLAFVADAHPKTVAALAYYDTPLLRICRQHRPPGIRIAGEIDFTHLDPLRHALAEALRLDDHLHVNLTSVRFIDVTAATVIAQTALSLPPERQMIVTCCGITAAVFDALGAGQASQLRLLRQT